MFSRACLPFDDEQYRPFGMKLGAEKIDYRKKYQLEEKEKLIGIEQASAHLAKLKAKPETYAVEKGALEKLIKEGKAEKK
jgi:hypothetical protein